MELHDLEKILVAAVVDEIHREIKNLLGLRYTVDSVYSSKEARQRIREETYDLILIGTRLSESDGFALCAQLRSCEKSQLIPIILIDHETNPNPHSRATAFSVGANDLVKIPLNEAEFIVQVAANIQFRKSFSRTSKTIARGPFLIDLEAQRVLVNQNNESVDIDLTPIEFKMFVLFTNNEGKLLLRDKIRATIWGPSVHIESRSIDKHVSSLRRKMCPFDNFIQTTPGQGYSFSFADNMPDKNKGF